MSLIDEEETNEILSLFKENTKSKNEQYKKVKIIKILRGMSMKPGKFKGSNPFEFVIKRHYGEAFKELTEKQFFYFINDSGLKVPDYKKLANALLLHPEKTKELLPVMINNQKEGKDVFDLGYKFDTEEEAWDYIKITAMYNDNKNQDFFVSELKNYMDEELLDQIDSIGDEAQSWTVFDLMNKIKADEIPTVALNYAFLNAQKNLKSEYRADLIVTILVALLDHYKSEKEKSSISSTEISISSDENAKLLEDIAENEKKISELEKTINQLKKDSKKIAKEAEAGSKQIAELTETSNLYKEEKEALKKALESNLQIIEIKEKIDQGTINDLKTKYANAEKLELYFKYNFDQESVTPKFAVVTANEAKIAQIIFNEVLFVNIKEIDDENIVDKLKKDIKNIFIRREGLSTTQIKKAKRIAEHIGVETKTIYAGSEKRLIQEISNILGRYDNVAI